ncbi:hypothetical protein IV87_GL001362 [Pediococcus ethanolidurans]|uniref:Uncharacterized protein n=1 Tax=Pediococcus ethanolidurans TaxID=319653 RepID=A0A0R2K179_9LACO|nr:hypothetical protein IV87_GL001362 [Pediococcus ethanolidurans]
MNSALRHGVSNSNGAVTMKMMNKLSDATNISSLPAKLLPQMRAILHNGLHNIMLLSLVLMFISLAINIWAQYLERRAHVEV